MKIVLSYTLALCILAFIVHQLSQDWETICSMRWWDHPLAMSLHIVLLAITFGLLVMGWHRVLKGTGNSITIRAAAFTWLVPNLGKYVPGKVLMLAGRVTLLRHQGIRTAAGFGNIIWEHIILVVAAAPFTLIGLLMGGKINSSIMLVAVTCICTFTLLFLSHPNLFQRLMNLTLTLLRRPPLELTLERKSLLSLFVIYLLLWILYGLSGVALAYALGIGNQIPFLVLLLAFVASWLIGFVSMLTPGGLGVREAALIVLVSPFIPTSQAMAFSLLARATWTIVEMSGVALGLLLGKNLSAHSPPKI